MKTETITQLKVANLSAADRGKLEQAKTNLLELQSELEAKGRKFNALTAALLDARSRHAQHDRNAETSVKSATELAAADIQIGKLDPEVNAFQKSIAMDLRYIASQVERVRKDISKTVSGELAGQLHAELKEALKPFFAPKYLDRAANSVLPETSGYAQLLFFCNRPAPRDPSTVDEAREAIGERVARLDAILNGDILLEIEPPQDPPENPKPSVTLGL